MILPTLISVSLAPGSYFFCAATGPAAPSAMVATASTEILSQRSMIASIILEISEFPWLRLAEKPLNRIEMDQFCHLRQRRTRAVFRPPRSGQRPRSARFANGRERPSGEAG